MSLWRGAIKYPDVPSNFGSQFLHKLWLHEGVIVRNVQCDNALAAQDFCIFPPQPTEMGLLHDEDDVPPADVPFRDHNPGVGLGACRPNLKTGNTLENLLSGQAPKPILAAHEQELCRVVSWRGHVVL